MFMRMFCAFLIWTLSSQVVFSETYIRDYTYKASEADSKLTSRTIALDQVKKLLLQEIGTHIRQKINITKDGSGSTYASEDVEAITAGLTKVEILEDRWNGETYYLKAKIDADTERVLNAIEEFKKSTSEENIQYLQKLKANQRILKKAREEINLLKRQLEETKSIIQKQKVASKYLKEVKQITAAEMFEKGANNDKSHQYIDAVYWYRKAAEQGSTMAQNNLGAMYTEGQGTKQNYHKAVSFFREAAKDGHSGAQHNLGVMYLNGWGIKEDDLQAVTWFRKSAEQGFDSAQNSLGWMYEVGRGVKQDIHQAIIWYRKAAEQGLARSQYDLGRMYLTDQGIELDIFSAKKWFRKACDGGHKDGCVRYKAFNDLGI